MAARSDAAAAPGPKDGAFMSFNVFCSSPNIVDLPPIHKECSPEHIYDRQKPFGYRQRIQTQTLAGGC